MKKNKEKQVLNEKHNKHHINFLGTLGGCISGERAPPQYWRTVELHELILSACFTALWSIHTITFLLESLLQETETGEPSESTATVHKEHFARVIFRPNPHTSLFKLLMQ